MFEWITAHCQRQALEDCEVWEIRRNVLDRLMRLPSQRHRFENEYRESSLDLALQNTDLFSGIEPGEYSRIVDYLRQRLSLCPRRKPGQTLFEEGELRRVFISFVSANVV